MLNKGFYLTTFMLGALLMLLVSAHGVPTKPNRPNSLGIDQLYSNPNIYLFGSAIDGTIIRGEHDDLYTNIRFQPYHTASLYDETVLFCGDVSEDFKGRRGALVVTYDRRASRSFRGIGCHELQSVFLVPPPKEAPVSQ